MPEGQVKRKPMEEDDWKAVFGKTERTVLAPLEKKHKRRANNGGSGFRLYQCMDI